MQVSPERFLTKLELLEIGVVILDVPLRKFILLAVDKSTDEVWQTVTMIMPSTESAADMQAYTLLVATIAASKDPSKFRRYWNASS